MQSTSPLSSGIHPSQKQNSNPSDNKSLVAAVAADKKLLAIAGSSRPVILQSNTGTILQKEAAKQMHSSHKASVGNHLLHLPSISTAMAKSVSSSTATNHSLFSSSQVCFDIFCMLRQIPNMLCHSQITIICV